MSESREREREREGCQRGETGVYGCWPKVAAQKKERQTSRTTPGKRPGQRRANSRTTPGKHAGQRQANVPDNAGQTSRTVPCKRPGQCRANVLDSARQPSRTMPSKQLVCKVKRRKRDSPQDFVQQNFVQCLRIFFKLLYQIRQIGIF